MHTKENECDKIIINNNIQHYKTPCKYDKNKKFKTES